MATQIWPRQLAIAPAIITVANSRYHVSVVGLLHEDGGICPRCQLPLLYVERYSEALGDYYVLYCSACGYETDTETRGVHEVPPILSADATTVFTPNQT